MAKTTSDHPLVAQRALIMLGWLALALALLAALLTAGAIQQPGSNRLLLIALALVLAAATCWRLRRRIALAIHESQAWAEVASLSAALTRRDALWSELPAPSAIWDGDGNLVMATAAWEQLDLVMHAPPGESELVLGDAPRVFVVENKTKPDGTRIVLLREVTRERQALQAKDELLAIVGHELRTPLSSIKGYGQLMARQLATVQEQVQRLDHLISDVLDAAGADAGRLNIRREPLAISSIVSSATERFRAANPDRRVDMNVDADALIEGDAERLGQVMDNLFSNAAKYSPADSPIVVGSRVDGEWVRISITDRGRGIKAEHQPLLFNRFYRVPAEGAGAPHGLGLGLSIVRDLVEAHRGQIEVASAGLGRGSTFTVVLPVALALTAERGQSQPTTPAGA
jgi:signal transduction histidine kinase